MRQRVLHHTHSFEPVGEGRTRMTDVVRYAQRLGPLGALADRLVVRRDLGRIFDYRQDTIAATSRGATTPATSGGG